MSTDEPPTEPSPPDPAPRARTLSRRRLLALAGAGAIGVAGASSAATAAIGKTQQVRRAQAAASSSGSAAADPEFTVLTDEPGQATGDIFLSDMGNTAEALITTAPGTGCGARRAPSPTLTCGCRPTRASR
jgi:hypothetical protein